MEKLLRRERKRRVLQFTEESFDTGLREHQRTDHHAQHVEHSSFKQLSHD